MGEPKFSQQPSKKKPKRKTAFYLVGLLVLLSVGTLVFLLKRGGDANTGEDSSSMFIPMIWLPVWIAIFAGRKDKGEVGEKQKKLLYTVVIGTILLVLLALGFVILNR